MCIAPYRVKGDHGLQGSASIGADALASGNRKHSAIHPLTDLRSPVADTIMLCPSCPGCVMRQQQQQQQQQQSILSTPSLTCGSLGAGLVGRHKGWPPPAAHPPTRPGHLHFFAMPPRAVCCTWRIDNFLAALPYSGMEESKILHRSQTTMLLWPASSSSGTSLLSSHDHVVSSSMCTIDPSDDGDAV